MKMEEIRQAWNHYKNMKVLAVLAGGKWTYTPIDPGKTMGRIEGTRAEMRDARMVYEFPEFLEKIWKK